MDRGRATTRSSSQRILRAIFGVALRVFYRLEAFGETVPSGGPILLVANHPNGLIDPILLASTTNRTVRFLGKAPLFEMPVVGSIMRGFRALPVFRAQDGADTSQNERTFEAVFDALRAGDLVCLFPEGKSHDEPTLQKLKTGTARMALGAEANQGFTLGVSIIPVGLVYRAKRRFRSRIATCVGRPIPTDDLAALHAEDDRAAVRALTDRIAEGLRDVTLRLERWEDLPVIELAAQVFRPEEGERLTYLHEFAERVHELREREPEAIAELTDRVAAFKARLERLGLGIENLHARYRPVAVARFCARATLSLVLMMPLALAGAAFWAVPYLLVPYFPRWVSASRDAHATVQVLAGIVLFPAWWLTGAGIAFWFSGAAAAAVTAALAVPLGLLALAYHDWRTEARDDVAAFLRLSGRRRLRELLARERAELAAAMERLRATAS